MDDGLDCFSIDTFPMTDTNQKELGKHPLKIANSLHGLCGSSFVGLVFFLLTPHTTGAADGRDLDLAVRLQKSESYRSTYAGKVFRDKVSLQYFGPAEQYAWYRVEIAPRRFEYVLVDIDAKTRHLLFSDSEIAEAIRTVLRKEGKEAPAEDENRSWRPGALRFSDDTALVRFTAAGQAWQWNRMTKELQRDATDVGQAGKEDSEALEPLKTLSRSRAGGEATSITVENRLPKTFRIFWHDPSGENRWYADLEPGKAWTQSTYEGHVWLVEDENGKPLAAYRAAVEKTHAIVDALTPPPLPRRRGPPDRSSPRAENLAPDGRWSVVFENDNLILRATGNETQQARWTTDGTAAAGYQGPVWWAPNSRHFVAMRISRAPRRQITLVETAPRDALQPQRIELDYPKPGDPLDQPRPYLFHLPATPAELDSLPPPIAIDSALFPNPYELHEVQWREDSGGFSFVYNQRGHQVLRVIAIDVATATARAVIDETSPTFVCYSHKFFLERIDAQDQWLWMSERDGWNHVLRIQPSTGEVLNRVTSGPWVVRRVERVDREKELLWLVVSGIVPGEDPYHEHLVRVRFDGTQLTRLTDGDGTHRWEFSPQGRWLVDTYSRVDLPPVTFLRDAHSGERVVALEAGDWSMLRAAGWEPPERFVAKGRDGETDIHGIVVRPSDFDGALKYPVLEAIYAGPQGSFTPKSFGLHDDLYEMAELGFIVVKLDGMGTSNRSKAFHDVCWKNLADGGFPDRIAWITAAGREHPELDLDRVGIWGGSAGGQSALGALLFHGDFYHAAMADCGCHDNRIDKLWWNEQWMGWPIDNHYHEQSNVTQAHRLQGKLLLTVGAMDRNVDPASTMQVVEALIDANKDFELIVFPSGGHGAGSSPYGKRRTLEFFLRSLGTPLERTPQ